LGGKPEQYGKYAAEYFEVECAVEDVAAIYKHAPLTNELIRRLNPEVDLDAVSTDAAEIGYPEALEFA